MNYGRYWHTASVLSDGKVLVTGGYTGFNSMNTAELYDPSRGSWTVTGNMTYARNSHTASVLSNGLVLVTGCSGVESSSAELYDPLSETWSVISPMNYARWYHTASVLTNGEVLVIGDGAAGIGYLNSTELY